MPIDAGEIIESSEVLDQTENIHSVVVPGGVITGWTTTAGAGLDVDVAVGSGIVGGFRINSTGINNVGSLTPSTSNFIFANFAGSGTEIATFSSSLSSTPTATQVLLAEAVTDGVGVTAVNDKRNVFVGTLIPTFFKNEKLVGTVALSTGFTEVYTATIPANTFAFYFKVMFVGSMDTTSPSRGVSEVQVQANNSVTKLWDNSNLMFNIDTGEENTLTQIAVFESSEVDFNASITLDVDWKATATNVDCKPQWAIIEGV